jgi:hypothetical protein
MRWTYLAIAACAALGFYLAQIPGPRTPRSAICSRMQTAQPPKSLDSRQRDEANPRIGRTSTPTTTA